MLSPSSPGPLCCHSPSPFAHWFPAVTLPMLRTCRTRPHSSGTQERARAFVVLRRNDGRSSVPECGVPIPGTALRPSFHHPVLGQVERRAFLVESFSYPDTRGP